MDRRQEPRRAVERPCRLASESLPPDEMSGMTTNVSRSGMLVRFSDSCLPGVLPQVGEQARVVIDLPPSAAYAPRSLECFAHVVRSEGSPGGAPALALEVHRMQIRDRDERGESRTPGFTDLVQ